MFIVFGGPNLGPSPCQYKIRSTINTEGSALGWSPDRDIRMVKKAELGAARIVARVAEF